MRGRATGIERGTDKGRPYPEELVLAEADVTCKSETNLIEMLTPMRMAAQQQVLGPLT